jgi:hypothetical protein
MPDEFKYDVFLSHSAKDTADRLQRLPEDELVGISTP